MNSTLSDDQKVIFEFGQILTKKFDRAYWHRHVEARCFPTEIWKELGAAGHLGMLVSKDAGGAGRGLLDLALLTEGLATAGLPLLTLITGPGLALPAIAQAGSDAIRETILPALLDGTTVMPFAITEGAVGANLMKLATRIDPDGDGYVVTGTKNFTSLADIAQHVLILGRSTDPESGRDGFTLAVVPTDAPGFHCEPSDTLVPMPEKQSTLTFDRLSIGSEFIVGRPAAALQVLAPALVWERVLSAALSIGIGARALQLAVSYTRDREVFGKPLATHQGVQHPLARARIRIEGARLQMRNAAALADAGEAAHGEANMAVWAGGEAGFEAADAALQTHGGYGYTRESDILELQQMARLLRSAPVHAESALNAVGEGVLGLPRSS